MTAAARTALVTGGSRGIGYGIAEHLAATNWSLTLVARRGQQLAQAQARLQTHGARVNVVALDLAEQGAAAQAVESHNQAFGSLTALIMAAGVGSSGPIAGYPMTRFDKQFAVNIRAPYELVGNALPFLRSTAQADPTFGAKVIAISSIEGIYPEAGLSAYAASKAALLSLIRSVNREEAQNAISATAVSPAFVDTEMSAWTAKTIAPTTMITVADVVKVVRLTLDLSVNAVIPHIVINRTDGGAYEA